MASLPSILVLGTSLTAGYGIDISESWPSRLQKRIDSAGLAYRVVNAGVSGETSAGVLRAVARVAGEASDISRFLHCRGQVLALQD